MIMRDNMALRLNEIRKERGLSITQFSEELGIARSSLQALLSGKANPRTDTIEYIADKLQLNPLCLLAAPSTSAASCSTVCEDMRRFLTVLEQRSELLREEYERFNL